MIGNVAGITVKPWSLIRQENINRYSELEKEINQNKGKAFKEAVKLVKKLDEELIIKELLD